MKKEKKEIMADTRPDVILNGEEYQDLYSETGITVGTKLILFNKSTSDVRVIISATKPANNSTNGIVMEVKGAMRPFTVDAGESGVFAKGFGPISVQEDA